MAVSRSTTLPKELNSMARRLASTFTRLAKSFAPNAHIRRSISTKIQKDGGSVSLVISAKSPDARAYEKGSGIHSLGKRKSKKQLVPRGPIIIRPKSGKGFLVFPWEIASANPSAFRMTKDGKKVMLVQVQHPGVQAANNGRGYLKPASQKMRTLIRKELKLAFRKSLLADIRATMKTGTR